MAAITYAQISDVGTVVTPVAATAGGDSVAWIDDRMQLEVTNGSGSSINVVIPVYPGQSIHGSSYPNNTVAVANGATKRIALTADEVNPTNGLISWTYSATPTSVTVAVTRR